MSGTTVKKGIVNNCKEKNGSLIVVSCLKSNTSNTCLSMRGGGGQYPELYIVSYGHPTKEEKGLCALDDREPSLCHGYEKGKYNMMKEWASVE